MVPLTSLLSHELKIGKWIVYMCFKPTPDLIMSWKTLARYPKILNHLFKNARLPLPTLNTELSFPFLDTLQLCNESGRKRHTNPSFLKKQKDTWKSFRDACLWVFSSLNTTDIFFFRIVWTFFLLFLFFLFLSIFC